MMDSLFAVSDSSGEMGLLIQAGEHTHVITCNQNTWIIALRHLGRLAAADWTDFSWWHAAKCAEAIREMRYNHVREEKL